MSSHQIELAGARMSGHWGEGKLKILVVDDEDAIADTLGLILSSRGYEARIAGSAEDVIEGLSDWRPDLAILDVVLPGMNDVDLAVILRTSHPACRILLFSGHPSVGGILDRAKRDGHNFEILAKPVHPSIMLNVVSSMLSSEQVVLRSA